ncbi:MAG TPA: HoxN/HupN/NixA family nickel/cobalt transporter [Stellaceae bacterium]|nr:HoxN/HupN/NixA family nickel/cobalt transporter [Stellaceae bacterium]
MRRKLCALYTVLIAANLGAWGWAFAALDSHAALLGTALLAYGFGLRHAVDADHIAAIDNVTRKLMQDGKRPVAVGFFFALGHSSIVLVAATVIAASATTLQHRYPGLVAAGGAIGTTVSAAFLLAIAVVNAALMVNIYRLFATVRRGGAYRSDELDAFLARRGLLARVLRRLFSLISHSWQMYPLGVVFGLGFDTATEIGLLGIAAAAAVKGMPIWSILVFPALFAAGMSLVDTTDGVLMLGAYGWAFANPVRKLYYNLTITGMSVVVALLVGSFEALGLVADRLGLAGGLWDVVNAANDNLGTLGYVIIALFVASWVLSMLVYRLMGYDKIGG